ncbi:UTRA domain-containing protein [Streptomyces atratus]|uniref:UTRA domain-containing protein n=1 Tax=Streptomyces atratus TaxID=1893 RepID=UPI0033DEB758
MGSDSPRRAPDFRTLFSAAVLSRLGTDAGYVAVPLIAVEAPDANPGQVGALATLSTLALLLIGLPAGAWDRRHRRRVLIADYPVQVRQPGATECELLEITDAAPVLVAHQLAHNRDGRPLELTPVVYRGDRYHFRASITS